MPAAAAIPAAGWLGTKLGALGGWIAKLGAAKAGAGATTAGGIAGGLSNAARSGGSRMAAQKLANYVDKGSFLGNAMQMMIQFSSQEFSML